MHMLHNFLARWLVNANIGNAVKASELQLRCNADIQSSISYRHECIYIRDRRRFSCYYTFGRVIQLIKGSAHF